MHQLGRHAEGESYMKNRRKHKTKTLIVMILLVVLAVNVCGCGKNAGELTSQAVQRNPEDYDSSEIYIDDEAIALAGEAVEADANQAAAFATAAQQAFAGVNALRTGAGLSALSWSVELLPSTNVRAVEASQSFSHTRPNGSDWWTVNSQLMYGENLARGYSSANAAVEAWMNSPTHKANIMNAGYKTMAIAITMGADGMWYWAQEFGY